MSFLLFLELNVRCYLVTKTVVCPLAYFTVASVVAWFPGIWFCLHLVVSLLFLCYNALDMRPLGATLVRKFQEWALNNINAVFWQWVNVSLLELCNFIGVFDKVFAQVQFINGILDWLWYIDTAYLIASALFRLIHYNRPPK